MKTNIIRPRLEVTEYCILRALTNKITNAEYDNFSAPGRGKMMVTTNTTSSRDNNKSDKPAKVWEQRDRPLVWIEGMKHCNWCKTGKHLHRDCPDYDPNYNVVLQV